MLRRCRPFGHEVLVIDGQSTDGTREIARREGVRCLLQIGRGKGSALHEAAEHAAGEVLVFIDADGSQTSVVKLVVSTRASRYEVELVPVKREQLRSILVPDASKVPSGQLLNSVIAPLVLMPLLGWNVSNSNYTAAIMQILMPWMIVGIVYRFILDEKSMPVPSNFPSLLRAA